MASNAVNLLQDVLTYEDYVKIPEDVCNKINSHLKRQTDEYIVIKALHESSKINNEQKITTLENEVSKWSLDYQNIKGKLDATVQEFEESQKKIDAAQNEIAKLKEVISRLETETADYRHQRDLAVDERDALLKIIERRNVETERLKEDAKLLSTQLQAAINAKCEALVKAEAVESQKMALDFREKRMDQERERLTNEIQKLTEDLYKQSAELMDLRRDHTTRRITLEAQLSEKAEELKISQQMVEDLTTANSNLKNKLESSLQKYMAKCDEEAKLQESFDNEILAHTKLAEAYKGMADDANAKVEELTNGIKGLQTLLKDSVEQYGEVEAKMKKMEEDFNKTLNEKNECIAQLKLEVSCANDLIKAAKQETLETAIEELSPAAANISRLLNSGTTLTQIYMQYASISDELMVEKNENRRLNECMNAIVAEIEAKAPILKKQREEYERMVENIEKLSKNMESSLKECGQLQQQVTEANKLKEHYERENNRLKEEMVDLGRQVCFLLKEVESLRCKYGSDNKTEELSMDVTNSSEVISKHLVTFSDIQELQENNQKLLAVVRKLSKNSEENEKEDCSQNIAELKETIKNKEKEIAEQEDELKYVKRLLDQALRQVDMYREILNDPGHQEENDIDVNMSHSHAAASTPKPPSLNDSKDRQITELAEKLKQAEIALKELQEESDTYRIERQANDGLMTEQIETMRNELHELRTSSSKLVSQLEYSAERFKIMQANAATYKTQISALENKNKNYNATIIKHEQSILHLKDEVFNTQKKLSRAEVSLENTRQECQLLRDSEMRLKSELEMLNREQQSQSVLLANLDSIRVSLERSEAEGKARLEVRLDESLRECGALRRRLQEEQDHFRQLTAQLQRQTDTAKSRLEEEKMLAARYREELQQMKVELAKANQQVEDVSKKMKDMSSPAKKSINEAETLSKELIDLQSQLEETKSELGSVKEQLKVEKQHAKQFCDISESMEKRLTEALEDHKKYKEMCEKKLSDYVAAKEELLKQVTSLESELSALQTGSNQSSAHLNVQLTKARDELKAIQTELDKTKHDLSAARLELASLSGAVQAAEEKYSREVVLHSADLQTLTALKLEFADVSAEVDKLRVAKEQAEQALEVGKSGWEEREYLIKAELQETQQRLSNLDSQNAVLHDQIEALSSQMAIVQAQASSSAADTSIESSGNRSLNASQDTSLNLDEGHNSEQLLQVIKYLRKEKDIAINKFDVFRSENLRLKSQLATVKKQLEETEKSLSAEREESDISIVTAAKHSELLRKLETLNAITDSNRILRGERDSLQLQMKELTSRAESLEQELGPLREQNRELLGRVDAMEAENLALRGEAGRLRQRVNFLIERSNKTSVEDWRCLQQERESLAKQVIADKEALQKKEEQARGLRQDRARLEEQVNNLTRQHQQQSDELRRQNEELNSTQQRVARLTQELADLRSVSNKRNEELAKITEDLGAKEAMITDIRNKEIQIRKIAKKYKTQYEELSKTVEEEKNKLEEKGKAAAEAAANTPLEIPVETQEQYREEGRREVEMRFVEVENRHSDRLKELTDQVTSSHEEAETLRKENDSLKNTALEKEERAKSVLKTARQKIKQLTETKCSLTKQLLDVQNRILKAEQNVDEGNVRMTALKSQYESRIARLEKECADIRADKQRETETLNQRVIQLQRQLDKYQGAKPSTSSGSGEKATSDPPTANIKPMAGATQQSVTVTPWPGRGETPLASIRPMSMQSRTVAVLPTNILSSSSSMNQTPSQGTPVLVPPQLQVVHTTGSSSGSGPEGLSSSPTSSHTDYMPATSSASGPIRQAAVQPTVTTVSPSSREEPPQSAAESTQDVEAEVENSDGQQIPAASQQTQQPQQQQQQQQQQVVAMVLPRIEQQSTQAQSQSSVEQAVAAPSSQASSSSNTVTTSQAGHKRPRDSEPDRMEEENTKPPQGKRTRLATGQQEMFPTVTSDSGPDVEYQVPTSSQRDQDEEIIAVDSEDDDDGIPDDGVMEDDDGPEFDEEADNENDYLGEEYERDEQDLRVYDEGEGTEMDEENAPDQDNNEVEIMEGVTQSLTEDSNEVPNQSESSGTAMVDSNASQAANSSAAVPVASSELHPPQQQHPEATSSGTGSQSEAGSTSQVGQSVHSFGRGPSRSIPPLSRQQQQLLLGFEDAGDDSIVPSTPTLFVPRRSDGFGEAVSSPQVPQGRFTFSDTNPPTARAGVAQVASEGMDDTRMDLTQLEESGTGRSVPTTPLQVSPQGDVAAAEMSGEVGQSESNQGEILQEQDEPQAEGSNVPGAIPAITVTEASEEDTAENMPPPELADLEDQGEQGDSTGVQGLEQDELDLDEGGDGVSSEGEKLPAPEEVEEGCEAEATEQSPTRRGTRSGTARRSGRAPFRGRGRAVRPQPIVWNEPGSSMGSSSPRGRACMMPSMRGNPAETMRGNFLRGGPRARRMRGKPKGNFSGQYQMRF